MNNLESLQILDISENMLSGSTSFFNGSSVQYIYMQKNSFNGSISNALLSSSQIITIDLSDNEFSGSIPQVINEHSELRVILLGKNHLQGHIPDQFCHLRKLSILDLSHNRFNGTIPSCFANMFSWIVGDDDDRNEGFTVQYSWFIYVASFSTLFNSTLIDWRITRENFVGAHVRVEAQFTTKNRYESYQGKILKYMAGLDLSSNELTGRIPPEIGDLQKIRALNLSYNILSGSIPENLSNLKLIESLDLSSNNLSGQIPRQLIELNYLAIFNVSYNNLSGPTPETEQFANFDESNYERNPGLCGSTIRKSCSSTRAPPATSPNGAEEDESAIDMVSFYWSFAASSITFTLGLFAILWLDSSSCSLWFCLVDTCINSCFHWLLK